MLHIYINDLCYQAVKKILKDLRAILPCLMFGELLLGDLKFSLHTELGLENGIFTKLFRDYMHSIL